MTKTKKAAKLRRDQQKSSRKKSPRNGGVEISIEGLIEAGNDALSRVEPESALSLFEQALTLAPSDTNIMDVLAEVHTQLGQPEKALELLLQSIRMAPTINASKWFLLAQLQTGDEALASYKNGIGLMTAELNSVLTLAVGQSLRKQITKGYCSVAELFLTDLCYSENAEVDCEAAISSAIAIDPLSLDAQQALANLRLSQNRKSDASDIMHAVFSRLMSMREKLNARTVVDDLRGVDTEDAEMEDLPSIEFFIAVVKLLIECSDPSSIGMALELGIDLLNDDDENVEVWYIVGVAALSKVPPDVEIARDHLSRALEMMDAIKQSCSDFGEEFPYDEQYSLILDHLRLIGDSAGDGVATSVSGSGAKDIEHAVEADEANEWELEEAN